MFLTGWTAPLWQGTEDLINLESTAILIGTLCRIEAFEMCLVVRGQLFSLAKVPKLLLCR
jgi:hypothetical protein